ncbi:acyl-CoA dehydrogenase (plasmid) [Pseudonocardia sp. EC080610-09]|uniref:acyl-CoA dehydrogenase family protein n=1 Tax=unclassified Pseudonocardia TaxID=2619320 RepID=UPI0007066BEF|nr:MULTISPECIES: acyl-CoA dehydrogenase family protein [unclassified Pseudonocardia]ALL79527.1 acyl-CoA dehydrogenase [Pseudonocardia sp. EC080610-09]ALL85521.1 acyl-CoA dehydrogenase [Pseudonocardia sp. EC080619-01]
MYITLRFREGPQWAEDLGRRLREFADLHRPELEKAGAEGRFPRDVYRAMGDQGWIGPTAPPSDGGLGGGIAEYCFVCEEVARHGLVSPQIAIQGQQWLLAFGTAQQRARYLGGIARGRIVFSESISEPGAASSLKAIQTRARRDGDDWILTGRKTHVNLGHQSDVTLVYATTDLGLTAFLVDTDLPGVSSTQTNPIGLRMLPTADMAFDDVRVPGSAVLGKVGAGLETFLTTFNVSRLGNASELIGYGRRALAQAVTYAQGRDVGDRKVADFQGIQWTVANAYAQLYTSSLARDHAADLADSGRDTALATSIAKMVAVDAAERATSDAFALVGSHGCYTDTDYGQLMQDVKVYRIGGGSVEVMRNYIARRILRSGSLEGMV